MTIEQALKAADEFCAMPPEAQKSDWHLLGFSIFDQIMRTEGLPWQVYQRVITALDNAIGWGTRYPVTNEQETIEARYDYLRGAY